VRMGAAGRAGCWHSGGSKWRRFTAAIARTEQRSWLPAITVAVAANEDGDTRRRRQRAAEVPCATRFPCSLSPDVRLAEQRHRCFAMTALRQKLIDELELRGLAPQSKYNYISAVRRLAAHYQQSPDQLTDEQIKAYLLYLIREKQRARATSGEVEPSSADMQMTHVPLRLGASSRSK